MAKEKPSKSIPKTPTSEPKTTSPGPVENEKIDTRFAIPLDKEGRVVIESMRDTSRAKLRELVTDAALARELGVSSGESSGTLALPAELMYPLVGALSIFETLLIARVTRAPREIVERVAGFSREETQQLAPALGAVLGKYGSSFLSKYGEETALIAMLSMMTMNKLALVREEMEKFAGPRGVVVPIVPADRHEPPTTEPTP